MIINVRSLVLMPTPRAILSFVRYPPATTVLVEVGGDVDCIELEIG